MIHNENNPEIVVQHLRPVVFIYAAANVATLLIIGMSALFSTFPVG